MSERKRSLNRHRGMTLVELLGVMVVMAILAAIAVGGIMVGQERARTTTARGAMVAYRDAFTSACSMNPGMVSDRTKAWGSDGSSYTTQAGLSKIVRRVNGYLDDELMLSWDASMKCYRSRNTDPWGGYYVFLEYPESADGSVTYYACGAETDPGYAKLGVSVWATGNSDSIIVGNTANEDAYGIGMLLDNGLVDTKWQGFDKQAEFNEYTVRFQE